MKLLSAAALWGFVLLIALPVFALSEWWTRKTNPHYAGLDSWKD